MGKYTVDNNDPGYENPTNPEDGWRGPGRPPAVKNQKCPVDGHYCEAYNCENCKYEDTL